MPSSVERSYTPREAIYESDTEYEETGRSDSEESEEINEEELLRSTEELERMESGDAQAPQQVDREELNRLVGEQQIADLNAMKAQIEQATHLPKPITQELLTKVTELLKNAGKGQLDSSEIDVLKSDLENTLNEHPSFAKRLFNYLKKQESPLLADVTEEKIQEAMKKYQFTEENFKTMELPGNQIVMDRLMGFLREVNPDLVQALDSDRDKGFGTKAVGKLQGMIDVVYTKGAPTELVLKIVDQSKKIPWDLADIKGKFTGNLAYAEGALINNRWYNVNGFAEALERLSKGESFDNEGIETYLSRGQNSVDNGAVNKGIEIRRVMSGLYEAAHKNPYLFRHYLKQIPEYALLAMKGLLDYRGGGGNNNDTKVLGDRWNTVESSNILNWVIKGGPLPPELHTEGNPDYVAFMAQNEVD